MVEYIDREAALVEIDEWADTFCECDYVFPHILKSIRKLPAADVRPVARGHWTLQYDGDGLWHCSECGSGYIHTMNFCPNCGAEMMGGGTKNA